MPQDGQIDILSNAIVDYLVHNALPKRNISRLKSPEVTLISQDIELNSTKDKAIADAVKGLNVNEMLQLRDFLSDFLSKTNIIPDAEAVLKQNKEKSNTKKAKAEIPFQDTFSQNEINMMKNRRSYFNDAEDFPQGVLQKNRDYENGDCCLGHI